MGKSTRLALYTLDILFYPVSQQMMGQLSILSLFLLIMLYN